MHGMMPVGYNALTGKCENWAQSKVSNLLQTTTNSVSVHYFGCYNITRKQFYYSPFKHLLTSFTHSVQQHTPKLSVILLKSADSLSYITTYLISLFSFSLTKKPE